MLSFYMVSIFSVDIIISFISEWLHGQIVFLLLESKVNKIKVHVCLKYKLHFPTKLYMNAKFIKVQRVPKSIFTTGFNVRVSKCH